MPNNSVLILGAGFSFDFGLPLMSNITSYIRSHQRISPQVANYIDDLQRTTRSLGASLNIPDHNLETMLSVAIMQHQISPESKSNDDIELILNLLRTICTPLGNKISTNFHQYLDAVDTLLGNPFRNRDDSLTIVTTNYDTIIETCLALRHAPPYLPGIEIGHHNLYAKSQDQYTLCKLHGSCNWTVENDKLSTSDYISNVYLHSPTKASSYDIPISWRDDYLKNNSTPFIVPPTLFKAQTNGLMSPTWQAAGEALKKASRIVCIGFSFPDSDTYLKYFFASCLNENIACDKIEILDPNANAIVKRLAQTYGFGPAINDRLVPVQSSWQNAKVAPLFS